jgi:hypothetical protein
VNVMVPAAVERLLTAEVAAEIATAYSGHAVYPRSIVVDGPESTRPGRGRRFPGWPGSVLVLANENQHVCSWGVPLDDGDDCPVLVGGYLSHTDETTAEYASSVEDFIAAWRWDLRCMDTLRFQDTKPLLQIQAPELTQSELDYLRARLSPAVSTAGWPGDRQYRFEGRGVQVLLWAAHGWCERWISAETEEPLRAFAAELLELPGLRDNLWSNDEAGTRIIAELTQ